MMVYNIWDYWVLGLCPSSSIQINAVFQKLDLLQVRGWETHTLLGPLERANLGHSVIGPVLEVDPFLIVQAENLSPTPSPEDGNGLGFQTLCVLEYRMMDKVRNPVILGINIVF